MITRPCVQILGEEIFIKCYFDLFTKYFYQIAELQRLKEQLKRCLSRKYQNFLSSDWLPVEDALYFPLLEFYVPIMLEEKIQTPGGAQRRKPVSNLTEMIQEIMQDRRGNYSLLLEGKLYLMLNV